MDAPKEIVFLKHHLDWQRQTVNRILLLIWRKQRDRTALW